MLFHAGALMRLNELGLLPQAKRISSVSGGSIATGYLACVWPKLKLDGFQNFKQTFVPPILTFARQKIDVVDALTRSIRPARFPAIPPQPTSLPRSEPA
jgi:NTE family protein